MRMAFVAGTLLLVLRASTGGATAGSQYSVTDLGLCGGYYSQARGINSRGQVVGEVACNGAVAMYPFIWDSTNGMRHLFDPSALGYPYASAEAISDAGQVVGYLYGGTDGRFHAFVWDSAGGAVDLGPGMALDINNAGQVAGASERANGYDGACIWNNGVATDFGLADSTFARGINESGQVVVPTWPSVIWRNGHAMPVSSGYYGTMALDINDHGQVSGHVIRLNQGHEEDASFFWSGGTWQVFGGWSTVGGGGDTTRLNNRGQVVGNLLLDVPWPSNFDPFVWQDGETTYLKNAIPPSSGWQLEYAADINDSGKIVGCAKYNGAVHGLLLTPVPEPSVAAAFACGLAGLSWRRRR